MKRFAAILLAAVCAFSFSAAQALTADCPAGGFSVWVPDHFESVQIDPLLLESERAAFSDLPLEPGARFSFSKRFSAKSKPYL